MVFRNKIENTLHISTSRDIEGDISTSFTLEQSEHHYIVVEARQEFTISPANMLHAKDQLEYYLDNGMISIVQESIYDPVLYRDTTTIPEFDGKKPFHFIPRWTLNEILVGSKGGFVKSSRLLGLNPSTVSPANASGELPANIRIFKVIIDVVTAFNGAPTLVIGDSINTSRLVKNTEHQLKVVNIYIVDVVYQPTAAYQPIATFNAGGATVGLVNIEIYYSNPSAP